MFSRNFTAGVAASVTARKIVAVTGALTLVAAPALAHHPLAGMPMTGFGDGVLSGIGHPVLGFDHLLFVALMGLAAVQTGHARLAPLGYIAAMLLGTLLTGAGYALPLAETVVALSLLALGTLVLSGRGLGLAGALAVFAGFGLFHGAAFGGAIAGQEAALGLPVLLGYLIGLGAIQYLIALGAGWAASRIWAARDAGALHARLAGAVVAGAGLLLVLEQTEGAVLAALGWAV